MTMTTATKTAGELRTGDVVILDGEARKVHVHSHYLAAGSVEGLAGSAVAMTELRTVPPSFVVTRGRAGTGAYLGVVRCHSLRSATPVGLAS